MFLSHQQSGLAKHANHWCPTDLPSNFADVARVCIRLGIPYLWIDSLCIIQDSADDWKREAIKMHLVYRHAVVTIVATSATSTHDGFLERDFKKTLAAKVHYSLEHDQESLPSGYGRDKYMVISCRENYQDSYPTYAINESKWNTRAWTMQERSLSTRLIHFCRNKIFFECRSCIKSEENEPVAHYALMTRILWPRDPSTSLDTLYGFWQWCLTQYCPRNLTKGKDKLIAIQSVAEEMMSTTKNSSFLSEKPRGTMPLVHRAGHGVRWTDTSRSILESCQRGSEAYQSLEVTAWVRPISTVAKAKTVNDVEKFFPFKLVAGASYGRGEDEHVFAHGRLDIDEPGENVRLLYLQMGIVGVAIVVDDEQGFIRSEGLFGNGAVRSKIIMVQALGSSNKAAIPMKNGLLTCGETVDEVGFMFELLERSCEIQLYVEAVEANGIP
ncbi:uncharacterized protein NECHADRAFT_76523 [Fusarium vanettenii 77-13-4]|uniref:Heterokaryon incompatibility domain-containing protein n=1 Tax=Fusarium vanettenii (strain ATCC MYA-4622 / CBS 123669 / FGSC 9596 / NRRL 45880 / 77-13-4) TaxID=660122 RepID=C7Z4H5_FUSV7|nr:uncharacterized protein NECHADRAFT_76523 [Fusarium vanettenii 77-13-4]EEU40925.1 hypothetical protein NECHADRAFT_76523 [Fusarium vanettenii 77-13-4]